MFDGSTLILAAKEIPERADRPRSSRLAFAASLMSCGLSPSALSIIARKVPLEIFQAIDTPCSSTFPPATVKFCQNLRLACGPTSSVNSASIILVSLPLREALSSPRSASPCPSRPPGRISIITFAKVPSGIRSELRGSSASFMSYIEVSSRLRRWQRQGR